MGNFNDALLEHLADRGNGSYAYVDSMEEAQRLFVENLSATLQTIAKDAKIQVDFNPDTVAAYRLMGYENRAVSDQDFRNNAVDAGEIGAGHHVVAIYAVQARPGANGRLATVQVRWADPQTSKVTEINGNLNTWDLVPSFNQTTPYYQLNVLAAQFAEVLRGSPYARGTTLYQLAELAQSLPNALPENKDVIEFAGLVRQAASRD
jgi:Ca-activated chloride channel family protein